MGKLRASPATALPIEQAELTEIDLVKVSDEIRQMTAAAIEALVDEPNRETLVSGIRMLNAEHQARLQELGQTEAAHHLAL